MKSDAVFIIASLKTAPRSLRYLRTFLLLGNDFL